MAHPEQAEFFTSMRQHYAASFNGARVLEGGSLDINGSVRDWFSGCDYTGVDLQIWPGRGPGVPGPVG